MKMKCSDWQQIFSEHLSWVKYMSGARLYEATECSLLVLKENDMQPVSCKRFTILYPPQNHDKVKLIVPFSNRVNWVSDVFNVNLARQCQRHTL